MSSTKSLLWRRDLDLLGRFFGRLFDVFSVAMAALVSGVVGDSIISISISSGALTLAFAFAFGSRSRLGCRRLAAAVGSRGFVSTVGTIGGSFSGRGLKKAVFLGKKESVEWSMDSKYWIKKYLADLGFALLVTVSNLMSL